MYQPQDWMLEGWVRAVAHRQDSMPNDSLERMAWYLGPQTRQFLDECLALKWNVYLVFAVLVYMVCTPDACSLLPPHDMDFVNKEVRPLLNSWLRGQLPSGKPMTRSSEGILNLIPSFVHRLMDSYAVSKVVVPRTTI